MTTLRFSGWCLIYLTFGVALVLMILPLPQWAESFRPLWLLLVTLYWVIALPHRAGVGMAWLNGLMLDTLQGTLLGENALCFTVLAYLAFKMHRRFSLFAWPLQMGCIFILLLLNQLLIFWLQGLQGQMVSINSLWGAAVSSAVLWPWVLRVLTSYTKRCRLL